MIATDLVRLLAAAEALIATSPPSTAASELRRWIEIARGSPTLPRTLDYQQPSTAPTTYLEAIHHLDTIARPIITALLEMSLPSRVHRTIEQVDNAMGAGMAAGTAVLARGRPDKDAIRALIGHVGSAATAGLEIALTYPEAEACRSKIRELLDALHSLRPEVKP